MKLQVGQLSITGNFRQNNEDNLYVDENHRFFIVADGMGGQSAGEKASQLAVELVPKKLTASIDFQSDAADKVQNGINEAVCYANGEIMALGRVEPDFNNMGTTIVLIVHVGSDFYISNVGDSRCYLLRNNELTQLTKDHSLTQALVDAGTITEEEARSHRYKNVLYRYLGSKEGAEGASLVCSTPQSGDIYFLCTDGVTDGLADPELLELLASSAAPQEMADQIVLAAQNGGSRDNITCVVVRVE